MKTLTTAVAFAATFITPAFADEPFALTSSDVAEGQTLDNKFVLNGFGCEGGNTSPALAWSNAPEGTKSFVVTAYDPDAPTGSGWWHWVAFDISAKVTSLDQGAGSVDGAMPEGAIQSRTDFGATGFGGACPPPGEVHRYVFTVHALGLEKLGLDENASAALVGFMTGANSLGSATVTAVYTR
ncbi:kinase inhibitor [uncultured Shimia sp.]|uniref:kinase inhibitor n=1 Tax=uncultured Shimia sp. TaxID=573152 RepID=UPI00260098CB|nr:kinase inhibitor [uncultured Shimia sp.]